MATLKEAKLGKTVRIEKVGGSGALRQHFLDMGVIPGTEITPVKYAPMGDPLQLRLHGYELTLRLADADMIEVSEISKSSQEKENSAGKKNKKQSDDKKKTKTVIRKDYQKETMHPGLGEGGKFHAKDDGTPLPEGTVMKFALVGNQNCGKTTLFNRLTGSKQHVGNFPGVTVDRKDGEILYCRKSPMQ